MPALPTCGEGEAGRWRSRGRQGGRVWEAASLASGNPACHDRQSSQQRSSSAAAAQQPQNSRAYQPHTTTPTHPSSPTHLVRLVGLEAMRLQAIRLAVDRQLQHNSKTYISYRVSKAVRIGLRGGSLSPSEDGRMLGSCQGSPSSSACRALLLLFRPAAAALRLRLLRRLQATLHIQLECLCWPP